MRLLFLFFAVLFLTAPAAYAADGVVVECGAPVAGDLPTESAHDFCDIYTRQLEFSEARKSLSVQLRERQQNFHAPARLAKDNYKANLRALRSTPRETETYGPPADAVQ